MAVWQENLRRLLKLKEILILHGNVRDSAYVKKDGSLLKGLTELLREVGREQGYQKIHFWGVLFDHEGKGNPPMWSIERIESLKGDENPLTKRMGGQNPELQLLGRWLKEEIRNTTEKKIFVINYIDKLTPYSQRGIYPRDIALTISLIQKIIENITPNNRLIMIALQDTMLPLEYYTNSPRVAVMEIPMPDKEERYIFFSQILSQKRFNDEQIEFLSNITDGLYVRDLENIQRDVIKECSDTDTDPEKISFTRLRKIVNRYSIGTEEDPWAKLPLSDHSKGLLDSAETWFKERVIGQDHAVREVVNAIKKARAGVVGLASGQEAKPRAVFFFAGPTGVGKTFLAKKLAEYLFDSEEAFIRFDMSEFKEEHTVSKLIGSPPGYVGYEKGGMLTNAVKNRPFSVILFDEIEKAHPKIMDIFLQILDDGRLTDSRGQTVFFTEAVIIFTSNIGTRTTTAGGQVIDEKAKLEEILQTVNDPEERAKKIREHFEKSVRNFFIQEISRPELLNRIGSNIIAFNYLDLSEAKRRIIQTKLEDLSFNFRDKFASLGHRLTFKDEVVDYFLDKHGKNIEQFGGRGLVNALENEVAHLLAEQILYSEKVGQKKCNFIFYINPQGELRCRRES